LIFSRNPKGVSPLPLNSAILIMLLTQIILINMTNGIVHIFSSKWTKQGSSNLDVISCLQMRKYGMQLGSSVHHRCLIAVLMSDSPCLQSNIWLWVIM
jgi:hypothetical protein